MTEPSGQRKPEGFDRIRGAASDAPKNFDPQGKQSLFSAAEQPPSFGHAAVACPECHRRTVVSLARLVRLALPGVYVPVPTKGHRVWARCPACDSRAWLQVDMGR